MGAEIDWLAAMFPFPKRLPMLRNIRAIDLQAGQGGGNGRFVRQGESEVPGVGWLFQKPLPCSRKFPVRRSGSPRRNHRTVGRGGPLLNKIVGVERA